jgi:hypothetical protein
MLDAAQGVKNKRHDILQAGTDEFRQADIVYIKNTTGGDLSRRSVVGIDGVLFSPDDNLNEFLSRVVLSGGIPYSVSHRGKFAILLDPIADGRIGRAWVGGVCQVPVIVNDEGHKWAAIVDGETGHMETKCAGGGVRILHLEPAGSGSGDETRWAVVRFVDFDPTDVTGWDEESVRLFLTASEGCLEWLDEGGCEEEGSGS